MGVHDGHRNRMKRRFLRHGLDNFDDHNVLELLLFFAIPRQDTNKLAHRLMDTFGSLDAVFEAAPEALMTVEGVGESAATILHLVPECARRYFLAKSDMGQILASSEAAGKFFIPRFMNCSTEKVYLACLDAKLKVIDCSPIGSGGMSHAHVDIQAALHRAVLLNASAVILAHNHTSGIALPSKEDENATRCFQAALELVGITLVDHIVVAGDDFVSLSDNGFLERVYQ